MSPISFALCILLILFKIAFAVPIGKGQDCGFAAFDFVTHVVIFAFHNHKEMLTDSSEEVIFLLASFGEQYFLWQCLKGDFGGQVVHRRICLELSSHLLVLR